MFVRLLASVLLFVAVPFVASAQPVLLSNYPPTNDGTQTAVINDLRQKSYRFTMPSSNFGAGNLTLRLRNYDVFGEAIAELRDFTGSTTAPGTSVLMSFNAPAPGGLAIDDYVFTPASNFTLQADTTYWIVVRGIAGGSFDWMASSPGITPTGLATFGSTSFTSNGGTSWGNSTILTTFEFRAIPEPGALSLLGIASLGAMAFARRRRR